MKHKYLTLFILILILSAIFYNCQGNPKEKEPKKINIIKEVENNDLNKINNYFSNNIPIDLNYQRESDGKTALHIAVANKNIKILETLLKKRADLTLMDFNKSSPLDYAIMQNNSEVIKTICSFFNPDNIYFSFDDKTGAEIIKLYGHNERFKKASQRVLDLWLLKEIGDGLTIKDNIDYKKIDYLISIGANINGVGRHFDRSTGIHPLYLAVDNNDLELTKYLLKKGALTNIHFDDEPGDTPSGETPLMCAIKHENNKIAKLLITNGADVNLGAAYNNSPLSYAIKYGNEAIKMILIKKGAKNP
jgi:ankyrin repeat protein